MVTNADYAAYSRATGTPYPKNDEERIELFPMVFNWRKSQLKNEDENNIGQNLLVGGVGLGALALGSVAGRKALAQRQAQRKSAGGGGRRGGVGFQDNPPAPPKDPSGGGGSGGSYLPEQTKAGVYDRVKRSYPDIPGEKELNRAYAPEARRAQQHADKFGYGELRPSERKLTDPRTGEIFERGRSPEVPSQNPGNNSLITQITNEDRSLGLAKAMNPGSSVADNQLTNNIVQDLKERGQGVDPSDKLKKAGLSMAGMPGEMEIYDGTRYSPVDSTYAQTRLKDAGLTTEEATGYWTSKLKDQGLLDEEPKAKASPTAKKAINDRVDQFMSEISVGDAGQMLAGPEVAAEARQMSATESSRQSAAVRRLEKQEESLAKNILSELATETPATVNPEKAARIARNRQQDVARVAGMISDSIQTEIDEGILVPGEGLRVALDAQNTGTVTERGANTFRKWMQDAYKNDPVILGEMNEELSSVFPQQQTKTAPVKTRTLTETYEAVGEPAALVQNIDALDSAADQAAAPIERELQRNEDVDVGMAQAFLNKKRDDLEGKGLSPTRVERALAQDRQVAEAAELYASTGDEAVLTRFSEEPSSPVAIKAKSASKLDEVPTKEFFQKGRYGEFVDDLEGKDVDLTNRISELGAEQQQLVGRKKQLEEDSLMIRSAMDREKPGQDSYSQMFGKMQYELQNMPDPASLNVDIGDAMAERDNVRAQLKGLKEVGAQQFLADRTEGMRIGYQVDAEGKPIAGTAKTRGYRPLIDQTKGGGGRRVAEFTAGQREKDVVRKTMNPKSGYQQDNMPAFVREYDDAGNQVTTNFDDRTVQAKKTVYGLQTPNEVISEGLRPSRIPESSVVEEGLRQSVAAPEGDVPIPPEPEVLFVREKPQRSQDPLKASEAIRRARIEGDRRDPQAILRGMGFGV